VRRQLREAHGFPKSLDGKAMNWGISCVFSTEKAIYPQADGTCAMQRESGEEVSLRLDCAAGFGAATHLTGTFGFTLAAEVIRLLTAES